MSFLIKYLHAALLSYHAGVLCARYNGNRMYRSRVHYMHILALISIPLFESNFWYVQKCNKFTQRDIPSYHSMLEKVLRVQSKITSSGLPNSAFFISFTHFIFFSKSLLVFLSATS